MQKSEANGSHAMGVAVGDGDMVADVDVASGAMMRVAVGSGRASTVRVGAQEVRNNRKAGKIDIHFMRKFFHREAQSNFAFFASSR